MATPIAMTRRQAIWTRTALALFLCLSAAGCDSASTTNPTPSATSSTTASSSTRPPRTLPSATAALPNPCELAKPAEIRWLARLADAKPVKDSDALLHKCTWEVDDGGRGATRLRVAVADHPARRATGGGEPSFVVTNCTGTSRSSRQGDFCLDRDERGMEILHRNLYVTAMWADTGVNKTRSKAARQGKADQINKQLEDQIFAALPD